MIDRRHAAFAKPAFELITVREGGREAGGALGHGSRRCEFQRASARYEEFGVPLGVPNNERPLARATVENENLLKRKRLAKCTARESNPGRGADPRSQSDRRKASARGVRASAGLVNLLIKGPRICTERRRTDADRRSETQRRPLTPHGHRGHLSNVRVNPPTSASICGY